jgi:hypothetical protein
MTDIIEQFKNVANAEHYMSMMEPRVGIAVQDWINILTKNN